MPDTHNPGRWTDTTPTFYETLAAAAKCSPADAFERFHDTMNANARGAAHPVESFLEDYVPITPASA